jgi:dihydrofolate synthase/folylpolyglutamate synthase
VNLQELATNKGVPLWCAGEDYFYKLEEGQTPTGWQYLPANGDGWSGEQLADLPLPFGQAGHQLQNAAAAITAVQLLQKSVKVSHESLVKGLELARNPGRCQVISQQPTVIIDVAHNVASVEALRQFVESLDVQGRVIAVCGMLRDKEIAAALGEISPIVNAWYLASIDSERGTTAAEIAEFVDDLDCAVQFPDVLQYQNAWAAFSAAEASLTENDCLVVFGSFFISGDIIAHLQKRDKND